MVLRYWGERGVAAESFSDLVDRSAAGIRTDALIADLKRRGWMATGLKGTDETIRDELAKGRPVLTLIEDRPATFHYIVVLAVHERGIVFHDPARAPFLVMSAAEFESAMACGRQMDGDGAAIWLARRDDPSRRGSVLDRSGRLAPRRLSAHLAIGQWQRACAWRRPATSTRRSSSLRRQLDAQRPCANWRACGCCRSDGPEASDLASAATAADGQDVYAWKLLATSRFVEGDRMGALAAWNRVGEPRLDLVRIDGLTRTRHRVVERLLSVDTGERTHRSTLRAREATTVRVAGRQNDEAGVRARAIGTRGTTWSGR